MQVPGELKIIDYQNEIITPCRYPFVSEDVSSQAVARLRDDFGLDDVVAPGASEWERWLLLRDWVHGRWSHGWSRIESRRASDILAAAAGGKDFNCAYYAATLAQCVVALGGHARLVSIHKESTEWVDPSEDNAGHSVCEVWSQDWHKWVILDADLNAHYEFDGVPLHAVEIRRHWLRGEWQAVSLVSGTSPVRTTSAPDSLTHGPLDQKTINENLRTFTRYKTMDYYRRIRWDLRMDVASGGKPGHGLRWFDGQDAPQLASVNESTEDDVWTSVEADAYWSMNQAEIQLRLSAVHNTHLDVEVRLLHSMPNLSRLLVRTSDTAEWTESSDSFQWEVRPGKNAVSAKPVNTLGQDGYTSRIVLRYLPAPRT